MEDVDVSKWSSEFENENSFVKCAFIDAKEKRCFFAFKCYPTQDLIKNSNLSEFPEILEFKNRIQLVEPQNQCSLLILDPDLVLSKEENIFTNEKLEELSLIHI